MTKQFNSFGNFHDWLVVVKEKAKKEATKEIAEQWYLDSQKYTYWDTGDMFTSGIMNSDFDSGLIIERAPQVKWLYYTTWVKPKKNKLALPQWFEATRDENLNKYKNIYINSFKKAKKDV